MRTLRWPTGARRAVPPVLIALVLAGCGGATRQLKPAPTTALSHTTSAPSPPAPPPTTSEWLGLNYNSSTGIGSLEQFVAHGIVYDRDGPLQVPAGETAAPSSRLGQGLRVSIAAGMMPDIVIDPTQSSTGCDGDPNVSTLCIPTSAADIAAFVSSFVKTAVSVRATFPHRAIVFEPMNEPWDWGAPPGTAPGQRAAAEYAAVLARLLPAVEQAGIPLDEILVQATTNLADKTEWIPDLYAAQPCLAPGTTTCGPIEGWSLHPYGLPGHTQQGISSVPVSRAQMRSGTDNIYVTEIGFCSTVAYGGRDCNQNATDLDGDGEQISGWLSETLQQALAMHDAGWLRALILWDRGGDAWGMENPDGSLTAAGQVLIAFADRNSTPAQRSSARRAARTR
jgi:hypothetical protein